MLGIFRETMNRTYQKEIYLKELTCKIVRADDSEICMAG